jgi:hypothetical protein
MFQRKQKRFRRHTSDRRHSLRPNGDRQPRMGSNSFTNGQSRNNFRPSLSAEKLFEKYSVLSKEAMTSGDKVLSENYLQHADHFMRIIKDKQRNQTENKLPIIDKTTIENKKIPSISEVSQDESLKSKE